MDKLSFLYDAFIAGAGISTDTRTIREGDIFFALKGEAFDGNAFIDEALSKGARIAVSDDPAHTGKDPRVIVTEHSLEMLSALARRYRHDLDIPVLALTGSNGKTTTKELIQSVLAKKYKVSATQGNLNNHIGVPLTLLRIPAQADFAVIEMGANHPEEISGLCRVADPEYGLITNIGKAHLEGFGGYAGVIRAKSELYAHLRENMGTVFVNAGDPLLMRLSEGMNRHTYGTGSILDAEARSQGFHLVVHWTNGPGSLKETPMQLSGSYNLQNVLAAARIGMHFDIPWQDIHDAIASYVPSNSRSELRQSGKNTLIMDAYNANPTSMEAALHNFKGLHGHPKWVILGDMLELGEAAEEEHLRILSLVDHMALEQVVLVGPLFHRLAEGRFITFAHASECLEWLKGKAPEKALILLKASRGIRLETLLPAL